MVHVHGQDAVSTDPHRPPTCCRPRRGLVAWFLGKEIRGEWRGRNVDGKEGPGKDEGREDEVLCDVSQEADAKKRSRAPRMWQKCYGSKQLHVRIQSGHRPALSPRGYEGSSWVGWVGLHILGPCLSALQPIIELTLSVSWWLTERNARKPQMSQLSLFVKSQMSPFLEP